MNFPRELPITEADYQKAKESVNTMISDGIAWMYSDQGGVLAESVGRGVDVFIETPINKSDTREQQVIDATMKIIGRLAKLGLGVIALTDMETLLRQSKIKLAT